MATVQYSDPANEILDYPCVLGFSPTIRHTNSQHRVGTIAHGLQGTMWVYVKASEAVATGTCTVTVSGAGQTYNAALTDAAGNHTALAAFASGEYGWVKQTADEIA